MALMPKRVKHRKSQRGRIKGNATRGNRVVFGEFGLQATQGGWVSAADDRSRPYRGARNTSAAKGGCTSAFSRTSRSPRSRSKPAWVRARASRSIGRPSVRPGTVLFELGGVTEAAAKMCLARLAHKMPIRVRMVQTTQVNQIRRTGSSAS